MSFRHTGQARYGHVPPAQYTSPPPPPPPAPPPPPHPNHRPDLRRSSFDTGDDSALNESPPARATTTTSRYSYMPNHGELFMDTDAPAAAGFQHQYQPAAATTTTTTIDPPPLAQSPRHYNPQHFARTQPSATSPVGNVFGVQAHHPGYSPMATYPSAAFATSANPTYSPSKSLGYGQSPTSPFGHQPYVPAAYHAFPPPQPLHRQGTISQTSYQQQQQQQQQQQVLASQWSPTSPSFGVQPPRPLSIQQPPTHHRSSSNAPVPPGVAARYTPAIPPYPSDGHAYDPSARDAWESFPGSGPQDGMSRIRRESQHSIHASPPRQTATAISTSPSSLHRHPTLRPLPSAPVDEGNDTNASLMRKSTEEMRQDAMFDDIVNNLGGGSMLQQGDGKGGDLLDYELGGSDSPAPRSTMVNTDQVSLYDNEDDSESDPEAAAGLEAMRIAEEQEAQGWGTGFSYEPQATRPPVPTPSSETVSNSGEPARSQSSRRLRQPSLEESEDGEFQGMDLSLVGGGYDAHMSYGHGDLIRHSSAKDNDKSIPSRPLPRPDVPPRTDSGSFDAAHGGEFGGMQDYALPSAGALHPFPAFDSGPPTISSFSSSSDLTQPVRDHRMSFDEGDEMGMRGHPSYRASASNAVSPLREDSTENYYGTYPRPLPSVPPMSENRTPNLMPAGTYRHTMYAVPSSEMNRGPYMPMGPDAYEQTMLTSTGQLVPRSTSLVSHSNTPQPITPVRSKTDSEERQARLRAAKLAGARGGSGLDGYDASAPGSVTLDLPDLPAGRRKKFQPTRLGAADFDRCREPWALSGLANWARDVAGGDSGEGEADLRSRTLEEGFVALFTYMVPTMNTADAETLSAKVVMRMLQAGVLLQDEEWVKFGGGVVSGVLWQLAGHGCYAPRVHQQEIPGRCYSHHCSRTLKKINLHAQTLEPSRKLEDWATFYKVTREQVEQVSKKELERQNNLHEIVMSEDTYMDHLNVLRVLYRDDLSTWQPPIITKNKLPRFVADVFGKVEAIKEVNENYLLPQLKYRQKEQGPWVLGFSDIFREWIRKAKTAYIEYASGFPIASYLVRQEAHNNLLFRQFLDQARDNKLSGRLDWNTYLKAPITRLQRYTLLLSTVLKNMSQQTEERANLSMAIEEIRAVTLECDAKVDEFGKKVQLKELQEKLQQRTERGIIDLHLDHLGRQLIHEGDLQRAGNNRFTWLETHAILFDHYFVLAKFHRDSSGRKETWDVSKRLLVLESTDDDPERKSGVKGLGAVTTTMAKPVSTDSRPSRATMNSSLEKPSSLEHTNSLTSLTSANSATRVPQVSDDGKALYPFRIKHLGQSESYTLYTKSPEARQEWCQKILEAKTAHAASLLEQNAEPFKLRIMADTAFASDAMAAAASRSMPTVPGTPLDRAIRDMEAVYGAGSRPPPVCRAQVNCATSFTTHGRAMLAIGTDYGVYITGAADPRGWARAIQIAKVTQISVLTEFSLILVLADKSLIAYHLSIVVPPSTTASSLTTPNDTPRRAPQKLSGTKDVSFFATARMKDRVLIFFKKKDSMHSTFKVLEPVFQKSSEKKSRFFSMSRRHNTSSSSSTTTYAPAQAGPAAGHTEFFREFDEFYIPTECFSINLFHTYMAISTTRGFELLTLDKKQPLSIPADFRDDAHAATASIATRLVGLRPLGMFRLGDAGAEFLLAYEECAVYVDKHGDVSRSVVMEFVGRARTAALYGPYLVLFDADFVEVRNVENGRLRQVISGKDIRCLDRGEPVYGSGALREAGSHAAAAGGWNVAATTTTTTTGTTTATTAIDHGTERRTLKLAMVHPENAAAQLVVELVLNDGHVE